MKMSWLPRGACVAFIFCGGGNQGIISVIRAIRAFTQDATAAG
jgi:hypothetical protein